MTSIPEPDAFEPEEDPYILTLIPRIVYKSILRGMKELATEIEQSTTPTAEQAQKLVQLVTDLEQAHTKIRRRKGQIKIVYDEYCGPVDETENAP